MPAHMGRKTMMWFEAFATRTFYFTGFAAEISRLKGQIGTMFTKHTQSKLSIDINNALGHQFKPKNVVTSSLVSHCMYIETSTASKQPSSSSLSFLQGRSLLAIFMEKIWENMMIMMIQQWDQRGFRETAWDVRLSWGQMTNHDSQTIAVRERFSLQEDHPAAMASRIKQTNANVDSIDHVCGRWSAQTQWCKSILQWRQLEFAAADSADIVVAFRFVSQLEKLVALYLRVLLCISRRFSTSRSSFYPLLAAPVQANIQLQYPRVMQHSSWSTQHFSPSTISGSQYVQNSHGIYAIPLFWFCKLDLALHVTLCYLLGTTTFWDESEDPGAFLSVRYLTVDIVWSCLVCLIWSAL